jgi:hypothetical protein
LKQSMTSLAEKLNFSLIFFQAPLMSILSPRFSKAPI